MRMLFAVVTVVVWATHATAQDFKTGLDAYDRGDYAAALKEWRPLAERGDTRAQFNLGVLYFNSQGVPFDPSQAVKWYRAAADQGYGPAQANLAFMYELGQGVLQNYVEAYKWSVLAAQQGVEAGEAREKLAAKMTAETIAEAKQAAAAWRPVLPQAAPAASGGAADSAAAAVPTRDQVRQIQTYLNELGFDAGPADGIAGQHTRSAIRDYQQRSGLPNTGAATTELLAQLAAELGDGRAAEPEAQISAREVAEPPPPVLQTPAGEKSPPRVEDCNRLAAHPDDHNLPTGTAGVAFNDIDAARAIEACELALARDPGNARYQFQFARSLHKAERLQEAVTYYQQAGLQGYALAQKTIGFAYANGLGVTRDYAKAAQWHHMAADQGDSDAQHNLGFLYAGGWGVSQDFVQAHMWYNIAAALGSAGAAAKRDALAGRMTNQQIAEAERRAIAWFDLHPGFGSQ